MVDLVFMFDLVLNFFLAYEGGEQGSSTLVVKHRQIARHYLTTWFCLDFTSTAVSVFDIVAYATSASDALASLKVCVCLLQTASGLGVLRRRPRR